MHKLTWKRLVSLLTLSLLLLSAASAFAQGKIYDRKVNNFFFIFDASGSMGDVYDPAGMVKAELSKQLMTNMNKILPDLDWVAGVNTFAPYGIVLPPKIYKKQMYGDAIATLPVEEKGAFGNPTPLGVGLKTFEEQIKLMKGTTAIILFTDGGNNRDYPPAEVAQRLVKTYPVCIHVVSFAQTLMERETIADLKKAVGSCGEFTDASALYGNADAQYEYAKKILWTEKDAPAAPVDKDSDEDGVFDSKDACPDTPKDLMVDTKGCPIPVRIRLDINFDTDKAEIKPEYEHEVAHFAEIVANYPKLPITIEGHTDNVASEAYNLDLSQRRAQSVVDVLVSKYDIAKSRIHATGYGKTRPIASNDTEEGRYQNRRVEGVVEGAFMKKGVKY